MGTNKITGMGDPASAQDAATKNYVDTQNVAVWSTGDVKLTLKTVADSGWVLFTDGTIGDASSNATVASAATAAIFALLYASPFTDATAPLFTSTGTPTTRGAQGTAASAYAAHCQISTLKVLGRALAIAGSGSGLTARTMGLAVGAETATIGQTNLPNVNFTVTGTASSTTNVSDVARGSSSSATFGGASAALLLGSVGAITSSGTISGNAASGGSGTALGIMDPNQYLNAMVKL